MRACVLPLPYSDYRHSIAHTLGAHIYLRIAPYRHMGLLLHVTAPYAARAAPRLLPGMIAEPAWVLEHSACLLCCCLCYDYCRYTCLRFFLACAACVLPPRSMPAALLGWVPAAAPADRFNADFCTSRSPACHCLLPAYLPRLYSALSCTAIYLGYIHDGTCLPDHTLLNNIYLYHGNLHHGFFSGYQEHIGVGCMVDAQDTWVCLVLWNTLHLPWACLPFLAALPG